MIHDRKVYKLREAVELELEMANSKGRVPLPTVRPWASKEKAAFGTAIPNAASEK